MKIRVASYTRENATLKLAGQDDGISIVQPLVTVKSIPFCRGGNPSEWNALVPVKISTSTGTSGSALAAFTLPITVSSDTTRNAKNRRRVVLRIAAPYQAITRDAGGNLIPDASRSGGEVAMHVVLSVPKALEDDALGKNDLASSQAAAAQVALLSRILSGLLGPDFADAGRIASVGESVNDIIDGGAVQPVDGDLVLDGGSVTDGVHHAVAYPEAGSSETDVGGVSGYAVTLAPYRGRLFQMSIQSGVHNGQPGILIGATSNRSLADVNMPLSRGLNGMSPVCGDTAAYIVGSVQDDGAVSNTKVFAD